MKLTRFWIADLSFRGLTIAKTSIPLVNCFVPIPCSDTVSTSCWTLWPSAPDAPGTIDNWNIKNMCYSICWENMLVKYQSFFEQILNNLLTCCSGHCCCSLSCLLRFQACVPCVLILCRCFSRHWICWSHHLYRSTNIACLSCRSLCSFSCCGNLSCFLSWQFVVFRWWHNCKYGLKKSNDFLQIVRNFSRNIRQK